ncbi:hypothetical protein FOL47_005007 [Perkinsus chesapeaki]|uniref:Uncharacterized protein n=1 Tax=Perkinsus chesapeaki TaxID=330153 RepID=A0A7J6M0G5_PERCH|nr:hypothetical protein FOL47_005007 [Perkinsus chesapeaki]
MRGVFFAVAEQRRLVDMIHSYADPAKPRSSSDSDYSTCAYETYTGGRNGAIVAALLNAFLEENSHPPVAGRLPPAFGPSHDRPEWMDDKAVAAVWAAVFFCIPDELLLIDSDACGSSSKVPSPSEVLLDLTEGSDDYQLIRAFVFTLRSKCCPGDGEEVAHFKGMCSCKCPKPKAGSNSCS